MYSSNLLPGLKGKKRGGGGTRERDTSFLSKSTKSFKEKLLFHKMLKCDNSENCLTFDLVIEFNTKFGGYIKSEFYLFLYHSCWGEEEKSVL